MYRFAISLVLAAATFFVMPGHSTQQVAGEAEVPKIITLGFNAYKFGGPVGAIKAWVKDGPLDGDQDVLSEAVRLSQAQTSFGSYRYFEVASRRAISPSAQIIYLTLAYERGPLFAKFSIFHTDQGWVVTAFDLSPRQKDIFPDCQ
jgi:hypothetical protein